MKYYIYLDQNSGKTIAVRSKRSPKPKSRMYVVFEWDIGSKRYVMAPFPEISDKVFFSDRFKKLGIIYQDEK